VTTTGCCGVASREKHGRKRWAALVGLVVLSAGCAPAMEDLRTSLSATDAGTIWFATTGSLQRSADGSRYVPGDPLVVSGDLRLPDGAGPFPAIVLTHGCGGTGNAEVGWATVLREWGYATFVVDSFRGRRLHEVCTSALRLSGLERVPDAYGALRVLATHPRIDRRRVSLMGFSHGGILTLAASTTWAAETYAPVGQARFRAFLPFYPYCNTRFPERARIAAPLRIHMGQLDDWLPVGPCITLVEELKASGQDATITVYQGAHHSFDNIGRSVSRQANVVNPTACTFELPHILGPLPAQRQIEACLRRGATVGWNPEATEQARRNVRAQLAELMK
jgi:dienelactone hydrolase